MRIGNSGIGEGELVTIGKVLRVHGVRGDVRVRSLSDVPDRFDTLTKVTLAGPDGTRREMEIRSSRRMVNDYLIAFEGIDTAEAWLAVAAIVVGAVRRSADAVRPVP